MEKFTIKYRDFLNEDLKDTFKDKIDEYYKSLKIGTLDLIQKSVKNYDELVNVQNFISNYIENPEGAELVEFTEEGDIYEFYLKFQVNIDEICNDTEYFTKTPQENNIFSLYDFIIQGTKYAVVECMKIMNKELF